MRLLPELRRRSEIGWVKINTISLSSIVFAGDNAVIAPQTRAIAVRRTIPSFSGDEGDFNRYPIFHMRLMPPPAPPVRVNMTRRLEIPAIRVGRIRVISFSTSAVFQAGSTEVIRADSRIKHFRQRLLLAPPPSR